MFILEFILACIAAPIIWYMDFMASIQNPLLMLLLLGIGYVLGAIWGFVWFYVSSGFCHYNTQLRTSDTTESRRRYL